MVSEKIAFPNQIFKNSSIILQEVEANAHLWWLSWLQVSAQWTLSELSILWTFLPAIIYVHEWHSHKHAQLSMATWKKIDLRIWST